MPNSSAPDGSLLKTGPVLAGVMVNWWLWGILIMQYIMYLNSGQAKQDPRALRGIVYFLFILDAAQSILAMVDAFHWFVYNFGNTEALSDLSMAGIDGPLLDGIIALMVQIVYCWRIWVLSGRRAVLPAIIALLGFLSCVGGAIRGIQGVTVKVASKLGGHFDFAVILWNATGAVADILIALSMTYLFQKHAQRTPQKSQIYSRLHSRDKHVNDHSGHFQLDCGFYEAPRSKGALNTSPQSPAKLWRLMHGEQFTSLNLMTGYPLAKLYSNCFMVLLNQRIYHNGSIHSEGTTMGSTSLTAFQAKDNHSERDTTLQGSNSSVFNASKIPTEIHVEVAIDRDAER
ncbi:hypothetical protein D9756_007298 [Leucocoprinus leucothites]|uniref:Uncharacterized protein n=1 Tax=Leucocoprinus leucothites TaxID=201217 RepID=A0A8H5FZ72_9AGAR|nr:hypothetical protein D9756_007298 [Leucoagaricus leucothites]